MIDLTEPQRQSPLAIVFLGIRLVRRIGLVQVGVGLVFLYNTVLAGSLVLAVLVVGGLFGSLSVLAWWRFTFQVLEGELVVRSGVLRANLLSVPIQRIQSLSIEQELLHRMFKLVKVSVDSAGSEATEFEIAAVSQQVAEALERATVTESGTVSGGASPSTNIEPHRDRFDDGEAIVHHDWRRLVRAASTMAPVAGLVLFAPLFAFGDEIGERLIGRTIDTAVDAARWWWIPIGVVAVIGVSVISNVIRVLLTDWDLTLRASTASVQRTSGLLSRTSRSSSIDRIQMITGRQNLLQRRADLSVMSLSTIGAGAIALIGCDGHQFDEVRRRVRFSPTQPTSHDHRIHPAEVWARVRVPTLVIPVLAVATGFLLTPWTLLALVIVPVRWELARRSVANSRWKVDDELCVREQLVSATTSQAQLFKANAAVVTQSIFERRRDLGRVHLVTAAGTVSVGMIPIADANDLRDRILLATATDQRPWM